MPPVSRYAKAAVAPVVVILAWVLAQFGIEVPEAVQAAATVLLVWAVPNLPNGLTSADEAGQ